MGKDDVQGRVPSVSGSRCDWKRCESREESRLRCVRTRLPVVPGPGCHLPRTPPPWNPSRPRWGTGRSPMWYRLPGEVVVPGTRADTGSGDPVVPRGPSRREGCQRLGGCRHLRGRSAVGVLRVPWPKKFPSRSVYRTLDLRYGTPGPSHTSGPGPPLPPSSCYACGPCWLVLSPGFWSSASASA